MIKISIVTVWFNEARLAPFFLAHYNYVDKIHIFLDADTNDNTKEICKQYDNVEIREIVFPEHIFDDKFMIRKVNSFVSELEDDWIYILCSDELIFPENNESAKTILERQSANLLYAQMWQSWRHKTDADLDPFKPSVYQRRYGSLRHRGKQQTYRKPIIAKPEIGIKWKVGAHSYQKNKEIILSDERFVGSHWRMADIDMAITRRKDRWSRLEEPSPLNFNWDKEEGKMREAAESHLNDAQMF